MEEAFHKAPLINRALKYMCEHTAMKPRHRIIDPIDVKVAKEKGQENQLFIYGDYSKIDPSWSRPHVIWSRHNVTEKEWIEAFRAALGHEYMGILTDTIKVKTHNGYAASLYFDIAGQDYVPYITTLRRGGKGILMDTRKDYQANCVLAKALIEKNAERTKILAKLTDAERRVLGL